MVMQLYQAADLSVETNQPVAIAVAATTPLAATPA
jgi:hypothetical protein